MRLEPNLKRIIHPNTLKRTSLVMSELNHETRTLVV